jgi:hypothetical protein
VVSTNRVLDGQRTRCVQEREVQNEAQEALAQEADLYCDTILEPAWQQWKDPVRSRDQSVMRGVLNDGDGSRTLAERLAPS